MEFVGKAVDSHRKTTRGAKNFYILHVLDLEEK